MLDHRQRRRLRWPREVIGAARVRQLEERIRELRVPIGPKTLEVEILKGRSPPRGAKDSCAL